MKSILVNWSRNFIPLLLLVLVWSSGCGKSGASGELVGVNANNFRSAATPYGMVYIPAGSFVMGENEGDLVLGQPSQEREVSVSAFYMDETEITNAEYRQFVNWVRDSIAITDYLQDDKYFIKPNTPDGSYKTSTDPKYIDWKKLGPNSVALWSLLKGKGPEAEKLRKMFYQGENVLFNKTEFDGRTWKYNFSIFDFKASIEGRNNKNRARSDYFIRDTVLIYPDTNVWVSDFAYAQNEPMVQDYFSHPAYNNYPVVGVTWRQARAFSVWRTKRFEAYRAGRKVPERAPYRLPTEAEFEYAARGGLKGKLYPWGGPEMRDVKGCLMANFKSGSGDYTSDGAVYTAHVKSYLPNDYGLYNMAGNVAEWTSSSYDEAVFGFVGDINPAFNFDAKSKDPEALKRKAVRGGSWKDISYFLQNSSRTYAYQDEAHSYIGFRCVSTYSNSIKGRN
ncbi:MAG: hypothetical protein RI924_890 [Bacteroidota bacterium]|jgi:formylglycine-generating enzyme required for sulfatase activity